MQTCQFITFGKHHPTSILSFSESFRFESGTRTTSSFERQLRQQQLFRRQSGTETGPPLGANKHHQITSSAEKENDGLLAPMMKSFALSGRGDDVDDIVGTSHLRSVSVPPRVACRSGTIVGRDGGVDSKRVSPPRMKRRKKKISAATSLSVEPNIESSVVRPNDVNLRLSSSFCCDGTRSTLASKRVPATPDSAIGLCDGRDKPVYSSDVSPNTENSLSSNEQVSVVDSTDTSDSGKGSDAKTPSCLKFIRRKSDNQHSPDLGSDGDADSKESGYITLEDLQAKLVDGGARSSWSSDERAVGAYSQATDQDIGSLSSVDERRQEMTLATRRSGAPRLPALECFGGFVSSVCNGFGVGSGGAMPLISPFDAAEEGDMGELIPSASSSLFECRSAPPTCDSSLVRFTFTVRLDSKMFRRRMMQHDVRTTNLNGERSPTVTLMAGVGRVSPDLLLPFPLGGRQGLITGCVNLVVDDPTTGFHRSVDKPPIVGPPSDIERSLMASTNQVPIRGLPMTRTVTDFDDGDGIPPPLPNHHKTSCESSSVVQQLRDNFDDAIPPQLSMSSPFVGEKVIVQAQVHRSADQQQEAGLDSVNSKIPRSLTTCGVQTSPAASVGVRGENRSSCSSTSKRGVTADDDDKCALIRSAEFSATSNQHHHHHNHSTMWHSFHSGTKHVDVDHIVEISDVCGTGSRKKCPNANDVVIVQSKNHKNNNNNNNENNKNSIRTCDHPATQTMKHSSRKSDVRIHKEEVRMDSSCCRKDADDCGRMLSASGATLQRTDGSQGRRKNAVGNERNRAKERKVRRRWESADSSSSDGHGNEDHELCHPCMHSANMVTATSCCKGHETKGEHLRNTSKKSSNIVEPTEHLHSNSNRKPTRRSLRQFFRVDNLFTCRLNIGNGKTANGNREATDGHSVDGQHPRRRECELASGEGFVAETLQCRGTNRGLSNGSRSMQRSVSGRSPSTSGVEKRRCHRSSRRIAGSSNGTVQPSSSSKVINGNYNATGSSRSVSPPNTRRGATDFRLMDNDDDYDDEDEDKLLTSEHQRGTSSRRHESRRGERPAGDGSTMPVGHRKAHRHHHRTFDVVDGAPLMTSSCIIGQRQQMKTLCPAGAVDVNRCTLRQEHTGTRCRQQPTTPAVTPITPLTPGVDSMLTSPSDRFTSPPSLYPVSQNGIDFVKSLNQLQNCVWYWGALGFDEAEAKLADKPDGTFLIRDSSDERYILSLSFRSLGATHHTRIEHYKGMFSFYAQSQSSHSGATVAEFIDSAMAESRAGRCLYYLRPRGPGKAPAPVRLLYPLSRLRCMHSLKHLCKFTVLRYVRLDMVDRLPVSPRLKEYLKQSGHQGVGGETLKKSTSTCGKQSAHGFHS